ncbi:hypothetical protein F511_39892 [Dorcoceras hygrometricum]|uniref:Uncharacterized protein n=1 Tax=Dorcoceras hygrometricum TaxID=472368 RepID=A0A2Z7ACP8_9LAMI|nr:hypothetical protein F511_39892 [Dorcoceras hygrometricum]
MGGRQSPDAYHRLRSRYPIIVVVRQQLVVGLTTMAVTGGWPLADQSRTKGAQIQNLIAAQTGRAQASAVVPDHPIYKQFRELGPREFAGSTDPMEAENWIRPWSSNTCINKEKRTSGLKRVTLVHCKFKQAQKTTLNQIRTDSVSLAQSPNTDPAERHKIHCRSRTRHKDRGDNALDTQPVTIRDGGYSQRTKTKAQTRGRGSLTEISPERLTGRRRREVAEELGLGLHERREEADSMRHRYTHKARVYNK